MGSKARRESREASVRKGPGERGEKGPGPRQEGVRRHGLGGIQDLDPDE